MSDNSALFAAYVIQVIVICICLLTLTYDLYLLRTNDFLNHRVSKIQTFSETVSKSFSSSYVHHELGAKNDTTKTVPGSLNRTFKNVQPTGKSLLFKENSPFLSLQLLQKESDGKSIYFENDDKQSSNKPVDVTLVTHLSFQRFRCVSQYLKFWNGPIIIMILLHISDMHACDIRSFYLSNKQMIIPVVYQRTDFYPINYFRNYGIEKAQTTHVFMADFDTWPNADVYTSFLSLPQERLNQTNLAVVIPTFSLHLRITEHSYSDCIGINLHRFPRLSTAFNRAYNLKLIRPIRDQQTNITFIPKAWFDLRFDASLHSPANQLIDLDCFRLHNTPLYVIVRKSSILPRFDNRFTNHGYNLQEWIQHLRYDGFEFKVLRDGYAVDVPHPNSPHYSHFKEEEKRGKPQMERLFDSFVKELKEKSVKKLYNECH